MDLLQKIAANSEDFAIENVIEGISVEDQLTPNIKTHLKDVILKDIHIRYFSDETEIDTTQNQISHWQKHRKDSPFLIAGRFLQCPLTVIEITAQVTKDYRFLYQSSPDDYYHQF